LTGAYEGWFYGKDGGTYALVGYFNRNTNRNSTSRSGRATASSRAGPIRGSRRTS
jgi:hypothetical protein